MWVAGSAAGNIARIHVDVSEEAAGAIAALVAREPPMSEPHSVPEHLDEYGQLLAADEITHGVTYEVPSSAHCEQAAQIVSSDSVQGKKLLASLDARGMPDHLVEMGFVDSTHLWPPWCVALDQQTIASVAFTARLSTAGAEVGVATAPPFRGRGLAAAATAAWASRRALEGRALFYSTDVGNVSSLRVAERLRLPFVGPNLSID